MMSEELDYYFRLHDLMRRDLSDMLVGSKPLSPVIASIYEAWNKHLNASSSVLEPGGRTPPGDSYSQRCKYGVKMRKYLFTIFDKKSSAYKDPLVGESTSDAMRNLIHGMVSAQKNSSLYMFPGDYSLHITGVFHFESGTIDPMVPPAFVCEITDLQLEARQIIQSMEAK